MCKYYCSGQVRGALTFVPSALVMRDLGFCEFASSQAALSDLRMLSDVPRTGIFCTFGRKKRQHAAVGLNEGCRNRNMSQVKSDLHATQDVQRIATRRKKARRVGSSGPQTLIMLTKGGVICQQAGVRFRCLFHRLFRRSSCVTAFYQKGTRSRPLRGTIKQGVRGKLRAIFTSNVREESVFPASNF